MKNYFGVSRTSGSGAEHHWLSVSDLMAGLMMVFLFISVALVHKAIVERDIAEEARDQAEQATTRVTDIAVTFRESQVAIYEALMDEFEDDLEQWGAEIDSDDLSFNFYSPDVLFESGSTEIRPDFEEVLADFFPRYLAVVAEFKESVTEVRIEGHTSSEWQDASPREAYFQNMRLSQGRTRSVLEYVSGLPAMQRDAEWNRSHFSAVGYSSAHPVLTANGREDREQSRRVSFRIVTNSETQIRKIIGEL